MKPDPRFQGRAKDFWAHVRLIGEKIGYTERGTGLIKIPELNAIKNCLLGLGLEFSRACLSDGTPTSFGTSLLEYFRFRAGILNDFVQPRLMDAHDAKVLFNSMRKRLKPKCPIPMNKQRGKKKQAAYLTGIVNMLIEENSQGLPCVFDPRNLTTITRNGSPLRTLARRVDGAFPGTVNPIAIWEIKEYYHTTTFGSRVADGIYETLLDGMELEELRESEGIHVRHYLMLDARYTWWVCGKSYLCRVIDMLHMGYVDEVLFGKEVIERLPVLVKEWGDLTKQ